MVGDEGEMSVEAEVSFSTLRWSSRTGSPSVPVHGDPPASLAIPGCSRSHFFPACTLMHTEPSPTQPMSHRHAYPPSTPKLFHMGNSSVI